MHSCFTLAHVYRLTGDWAWLWRSVLMFDSFMLPAPSSTYCSLLRPRRAIEEVGRRSLARAHSLSPGWIFRGLLIPSAGAIGCLPASLFLAAPANWNLISWAPAFSRFCQLDRRIPPPPGAGRGGFWGSHGSYPGFMLGFPIRSQACCFAQSHRVNCSWNKYVKFGLFSYAVRVSHLSLVGGVKQPWGGHILQQFQDYRNMKSPSFTP